MLPGGSRGTLPLAREAFVYNGTSKCSVCTRSSAGHLDPQVILVNLARESANFAGKAALVCFYLIDSNANPNFNALHCRQKGDFMSYTYYSSNGKKTGSTRKDIWGNTCRYGNDGRKKGYYQKDFWGNNAYYGTDGRKKSYTGTDMFGNKCKYGADGRKQGYYAKDIWGNDCFYGTDGRKKGYRQKSWF